MEVLVGEMVVQEDGVRLRIREALYSGLPEPLAGSGKGGRKGAANATVLE